MPQTNLQKDGHRDGQSDGRRMAVGRPSDGRRTAVGQPSDGRRTAVRRPWDARGSIFLESYISEPALPTNGPQQRGHLKSRNALVVFLYALLQLH